MDVYFQRRTVDTRIVIAIASQFVESQGDGASDGFGDRLASFEPNTKTGGPVEFW